MIERAAVFPLVSPPISIDYIERCLWSIESQENCPFYFDIHIIVNSLDDEYIKKVQKTFSKDYDVVVTDCNGKSGKGHNARLEVYRDVYKEREYTHMIPIDGDDYYYPMAFKCLNDLSKKSRFDYLSGMCPHVDSVRIFPPSDNRPCIQLADNLFLWSFFEHRTPLVPWVYWDGETCSGGEPTLCMSTKAIVDCDVHYTENLGLADDYPHLLRGVASYLRDELEFVNTDVNDVYVYDCTQDTSSSRKEQEIDPDKGSPFDLAGELQKEIEKDEFKILKDITRLNLPYVTLPQVWRDEEKATFVLENHI